MTDARTEFLNGNLVLLGMSCALITDSHRIHLLVSRVQFALRAYDQPGPPCSMLYPYTAIDFAARSAVSALLRW